MMQTAPEKSTSTCDILAITLMIVVSRQLFIKMKTSHHSRNQGFHG